MALSSRVHRWMPSTTAKKYRQAEVEIARGFVILL
jgi:hypothetical protein